MLNRHFLLSLKSLLDQLIFHHEKESGLRAKILIYIALHDRCTVRDIADEFGVDQSTVSRNVASLRGKRKNNSRKLRGFVQCHPRSRRAHQYELTETGERYLRFVIHKMSKAAAKALIASA